MIWLLSLLQLAIWEPVTPPVLHQGFWQTCDNEERVLEHRSAGTLQWELHMGPYDEFALYAQTTDHSDSDGHNTDANLLWPGYRVSDSETLRGVKEWTILALGLWVRISEAGEPPYGCHGFYVKVEQR